MGDKTAISWTDKTFNIAWGCHKISPGCKFCYAAADAKKKKMDIWGKNKRRRLLSNNTWQNPYRWSHESSSSRRTRVFCSSMADVFEDHPDIIGQLPRMWKTIYETPRLDWQLLTKRADRIVHSLPPTWGDDWNDAWFNVWLGVSVESDKYLDRIDHLRQIPAPVRFVSYEPALGPIAHKLNLTGIDWLIYGGESGGNFRKDNDKWAEDVMELCRRHGTAFFYKQGAARRQGTKDKLNGEKIQNFPTPRIPVPKDWAPRDPEEGFSANELLKQYSTQLTSLTSSSKKTTAGANKKTKASGNKTARASKK